MRAIGLYLAVLVMAAVASSANSAVDAADDQPIIKMINPGTRPNVTYAYSVINTSKFRLVVKSFDQPTQISRVPQAVSCNGLSVTGGFSRAEDKRLVPDGLIRTEQGEISSLALWQVGGVLWVSGSKYEIIRIKDWESHPRSGGMAIQGVPILVFEGKVDYPLTRPLKSNRIGVGTLRDGNVVFIGAFTSKSDAVTAREFAEDANDLIGANLVSVLNLDGGPSAFMYSKTTSIFPANGAVTTYLCAEPR